MEDFVNFKISQKLKEKGFPQSPDYFNYSSYYDWDGLRKIHSLSNASVWFDPNISKDNIYFAPIIYQVLNWLRKEKHIHINTSVYKDESEDADGRIIEEWCFWNWDIQNCNSGDILQDGDDIEYESYEQASLAGIEYVIENLI